MNRRTHNPASADFRRPDERSVSGQYSHAQHATAPFCASDQGTCVGLSRPMNGTSTDGESRNRALEAGNGQWAMGVRIRIPRKGRGNRVRVRFPRGNSGTLTSTLSPPPVRPLGGRKSQGGGGSGVSWRQADAVDGVAVPASRTEEALGLISRRLRVPADPGFLSILTAAAG